MKKIHMFLFALVLCLCGASLSLAEEVSMPISPNLMDSQWEVERLILEDYRRELYHLENPMIVVNPYETSPLTALLLFESPEKARVSVRVLGKEGGVDLSHDYANNDTFHQIPVVGLYADYENLVEVTLIYEDGSEERNLLTIPTDPVDSAGRPQWRDETGALRWVLLHENDSYFQRISNGNLLVLKEDFFGFYEMDLLGKLFGDYYSNNRVESAILELPSGNFLICADHLFSSQDRLLELERGTGEIVQDLDLRSIFSPRTDLNGVAGDWFQLSAMEFDEQNHSVWLYSRSHGTAEISYPSGEILQEVYRPLERGGLGGLYPSFWEFELLTNKGKVMAKNQQDILQTHTEFTISDGLSYDFAVDGDVFYLRNENLQSLEVKANLGSWDVSKAFLIFQGEETYGLNLEFSSNFDVDLSLDYEYICENVAQGDYSLGILLITPEQRLYIPSGYEYTVNRQRQSLEMADLLVTQAEISENLLETFRDGEYTLENPMIVVNPYGNTPLSALVCFQTEESGTMEVFLNGESQKFFAITDQHFLPIYGLYPETYNQLTLQFTNERGERQSSGVQIVTEALPQRVQQAELLFFEEFPSDFTFVSGHGLTAYDGNGMVRWYCDLVEDSPILRLENGNLLIHSDKTHRVGESVSSLYEIDLLGRVYHEYVVNGTHHQVQELRNGDFFIMAELTSGGETSLERMESETALDYLVVLDRKTGEIYQEWDIKALFEQSRASLDYITLAYEDFGEVELSATEWANLYGNYDWFHNNAVFYDEEGELITVSGKHQDILFQFDGETDEITWIFGDEDEFWDWDNHLDCDSTFFGQSYFTYLADGTLMVLDNGLFRDDGGETARIVGYALDEEEGRAEEIFSYSYLPASGMGDIHALGEEHFLFHFTEIQGEDGLESHLVEWKQGEEVFMMKIYGKSDYSARLPLYEEQGIYHNLSYETSRLGFGTVSDYGSKHLPLSSDGVDFTVTLAVDQGDRIGVQISCHNFPHAEKFLVLDNGMEARCYPMESEEILYINKAGVPSGDYVLGVYVMDEDIYTSSGYYVYFPETEAFRPLWVDDTTLEAPLYDTTVVVATMLCTFTSLWLLAQAFRGKKR